MQDLLDVVAPVADALGGAAYLAAAAFVAACAVLAVTAAAHAADVWAERRKGGVHRGLDS